MPSELYPFLFFSLPGAASLWFFVYQKVRLSILSIYFSHYLFAGSPNFQHRMARIHALRAYNERKSPERRP
jgi:hypothetical protein